MAILTNDKDLVRDFVRINFINSVSSFPDWDAAADRYLLPVIGYDLYEHVQALAADEPVLNPTASDIRDAELLRLCRTIVAPLAYMLELPTIHAQITDAGLRTISSDNMQAAHRWEYNAVLQSLMDKGTYALDALHRFLIHNQIYYPEWTQSREYKQFEGLLFRTGDAFNRYFALHQPHRVFWALRPLIREVEDFYIASSIGEKFYEALKKKSCPTTLEHEALELIKKAVASLTMVLAVERLSAAITDRGFTLLMGASSAESTNAGDIPAAGSALSMLHDSCTRSGEAYVVKLQEFLNAKASATVFPDYFNSDKYEAPVVPGACVESPNAKRKIFGL